MAKLQNPQQAFLSVNGTLFDWQAAGFKSKGWPAALKEEGATTIPLATLCDHFGDRWVNPASGGVIGKANIARELGMSERQLQCEIACGSSSFIRRVSKLYASNVASLDAFRRLNDTARAAAWAENSPFSYPRPRTMQQSGQRNAE